MNNSYKLISASQIEDFHRPYWWTFPGDTDKNVNAFDVKTLQSHARRLYANLGPLRVAIQEKAMYAVGRHWLPVFRGADQSFKLQAVDWLTDYWYPSSNVLGEEFDFQTLLYTMSINLDVLGEVFVMLTESDDGYPQVQLVPAHRVDQPRQSGAIGSGNKLSGKCFEGLYAGCRCEYGVVKNAFGRPIAFSVLADEEINDRLVPANDLIRVREIDLGDETRGIPTMSHGINQGRSMLSLLANEQDFLELASKIALIENNELGGLDPNDPTNAVAFRPSPPTDIGDGATNPGGGANSQNRTMTEEWQQAAQTRYFESKKGGKVEPFQFSRPEKSWSEFMDKLGRFLIDPIWPYRLVDREDILGGATARGVIARANRLVQDRQDLLRRPARKIVQYAIAKAAKIKRIPESDDWFMWDFTLPARITVDFGRDAKSEILECEADLLDPADVVEAQGRGNYAEWLDRKYRNAANAILIKQQVETELGVNLDDAPTQVPITGSGTPDEVDA